MAIVSVTTVISQSRGGVMQIRESCFQKSSSFVLCPFFSVMQIKSDMCKYGSCFYSPERNHLSLWEPFMCICVFSWPRLTSRNSRVKDFISRISLCAFRELHPQSCQGNSSQTNLNPCWIVLRVSKAQGQPVQHLYPRRYYLDTDMFSFVPKVLLIRLIPPRQLDLR